MLLEKRRCHSTIELKNLSRNKPCIFRRKESHRGPEFFELPGSLDWNCLECGRSGRGRGKCWCDDRGRGDGIDCHSIGRDLIGEMFQSS